jgi:stringent starvation protein B
MPDSSSTTGGSGAQGAQGTSTKPYLLRAIYEWCTDNGFTPYVAVFVNAQVTVPREYVKNNEIVLNVSFEATQALKMDNEAITFKARFAGMARDIYIPVDNVVAIYARENGQGMAFPLPSGLQQEQMQGTPPRLSAVDAALGNATHAGAEQSDENDHNEADSDAPASRSAAPRKRPRPTAAKPAAVPAPVPPPPEPPAPPPKRPTGGGRPALKRVK